MATSLSNLVNNLSERIHKIKCKFGHNDIKCETCGIKYKYCNCFLEYANFKDDLFIVVKRCYFYEYIDNWENFKKTLPETDFYSHLNMEDITDADYTHAKGVCKDSEKC